MRILGYTLAAAALIGLVSSQDYPAGCGGNRNNQPVLELPAQPLKTVQNGQSWLMQQESNVVYIARIKGTAYEMGYAYGQLYGQELANNLSNLLRYLKSMLSDLLEKFGVSGPVVDMIYNQLEPIGFYLLDLNWNIALPYIPKRYQDEIQGIADGSNGLVDANLLRRVNMIPEITQAACTILGAYGEATADGKLYHLRALDWMPRAYVNQYPSVIIYESSEEGSKPFANIGYLGLLGSLTAISKIGISVGEKVFYALDPADYPIAPKITYFGKPWMFVLRDTVQFANNINDAQSMLQGAQRTMMIHLGIGSLPDKTFRGVDYASNFITFYNDQNYTHYSVAHPQHNGIFYYDKLIQPSGNICVASILNQTHGKITAETMYRDVAGFHSTGDAQVVVMDPEGQQIWAAWSEYMTTTNAYLRSPIHIKLSDFWGTSSTKDNFLE